MDDVIKLVETLNKGIKAHELLEQIYRDIGPYANRELKQETMYKLQDYFDFDDSK
jgi:hypothetical protein